jgi:hypothetical protein
MLGYAGKTRRGRGRGKQLSAWQGCGGANTGEGCSGAVPVCSGEWRLLRGGNVNVARGRGGLEHACAHAHAAAVASKLAKQASQR